MQHADRQTAEQKGLTYCWTSPNTSAQVSPQLQERREAPQDPNITDTPHTQTQTETETFLATATHQEKPSLSGKTASPHGELDVKIKLNNLQENDQQVQLFQQLGEAEQ